MIPALLDRHVSICLIKFLNGAHLALSHSEFMPPFPPLSPVTLFTQGQAAGPDHEIRSLTAAARDCHSQDQTLNKCGFFSEISGWSVYLL